MRTRLVPNLLWGLTGVLSTLVGMALGHLVAALLVPSSSPVLAVGSQVIDATPTPMKEWAIRQFGSSDKLILIGSVMIVVLLLSAVAGVLARRRFAYGATLLVVLVAVAALAALTRPTAGLEDAIPSIAAAISGVAALAWLSRVGHAAHAAAGSDAPSDATAGTPGATRRAVLVAAGVLTAAAAVMGGAGRWIGSYRARDVDIDLPTAKDPAAALPKGLDDQVPGISKFRTPNADFYRVDTRLDVPVVEVDGWTLTIDGDVENELEFTFDDLMGMDLIERDITMTCVSNSPGGPYVGSALWLGVRLTDLLDMAKVGSGANQIYSMDFDGMTISTPLDLATDGRDAMIAIGMNGEALPREHGFPARMIVPGLYGFISGTKWIKKITLTTYDEKTAYWTDRDWATDAPIKISSRIDIPNALDQLDAGENIIGGVAWAQQKGGIEKVQVRIDGGGWIDAEMGPDAGSDYWRQWFYKWDAQPGRRSVACRAISGDGETQTAVTANPFPNGASGIQEFFVTVS